jgi:pyruvate dehydrogenase E2 component (dihydrolipoamide acetyltransferase)
MPVQVVVPPLGQTVDTMTFVAWLKQEGELVRQGEALYVVETDKAMLDVESPATGVLSQVTAQKGDEVKALAMVAVILEPGDGASPGNGDARARLFVSPRARRLAEAQGVPLDQVDASGPEGAVVERDVRAFLAERDAARAQAAEVATSAAPKSVTPGVAGVSPLARRLAEEDGVDLAEVRGTGPRGQITREDIEVVLAGRAVVAPGARDRDAMPPEVLPLAGPRKVIAERMSASSRETAAVTLTAEADATELVRLRERLNADGVPVSYNDLMIFALGRALRQHPRMNASLDDEGVKLWPQVNIALAVDTDRGLLAPVVKGADRMSLGELARATSELTARARDGKCGPEELRGGTFTLTNLGMFGIDAFTPIINLPECAILGMGRIKTQPVWVEDHVEPRERVWLSLTFDHRLVDGGPAARFLQAVVRLVERPHLLMA